MRRIYQRIELALGSTIEEAVDLLLTYRANDIFVSAKFNDKILYSDTVTLESAYKEITGKTKEELGL